jgi:two-component sensor histidine kinase
VVQVLAEQSGSKATSVAECLESFRGRLQALSAAHSTLISSDWRWASLASIVHTALEPYLGEGGRVRLDLQDLPLDPEVALTLALGFHELATNAAKYGALSTPAGRVTLAARIETGENGHELRLAWQEHGGPPVEPPATAGFGTAMLSRALEYQHNGWADLEWRREGLLCRLALPLAAVRAPASQHKFI